MHSGLLLNALGTPDGRDQGRALGRRDVKKEK